ncbi:MAG: helix-turn-helix domain-containing protein [Mycolicibacterium sp.]|nr:helix-turn-helix domain-containing protein [Mycolicibacterium sp.]
MTAISVHETPTATADRGSYTFPPSPLAGTVDIRVAAERAGVSVRTLRRWIATGKLPARRTGGGYLRIRIDDIDALSVEV